MASLPGKFSEGDSNAVRQCVDRARARKDALLARRERRSLTGPVPRFSEDRFWFRLMVCLLTTRQRSTKGSPVDRFLRAKPFALSLENCAGAKHLERFVARSLTEFGGIRFVPKISRQARLNLQFLNSGGWDEVRAWFKKLSEQRAQQPSSNHARLEREAAHFAQAAFAGLGPKQSRNLWQMLGLTRYVLPLDSRVGEWVNVHLSRKLEMKKLSNLRYYEAFEDYLQSVCQQAQVPPCLFDAAAFDWEKKGDEEPGVPGVHGILASAIDSVTAFLPRISKLADEKISAPLPPDGSILLESWYRPLIFELMDAFNRCGFVQSFDWTAWQRLAQRYVKHPRSLKSASLDDCVRLITTHVRKDRFSAGHFGEMVRIGHIAAILRRLSDLRDRLPARALRAAVG